MLLQEVDSLEDQKRSLRSNIETFERDQKTLQKEIQSLSEERDGLLYKVHFFYWQLNFPFEPRVANEILENEAKSCLTVA